MSEQKARILVVDDDTNLLKALSLRLSMWGYEVVTAFNGVEALVLAKSQQPDLIISDICMPAGSGFSLAFRLRQCMKEVPIIFLSASKQPGLKDIAKGFEAVAFLEKPYEPDTLLETITRVLKSDAPTACQAN